MKRRHKYAVVTAIYGGVTKLNSPRVVAPNTQYICYTDDRALRNSVWDVRYKPMPRRLPVLGAKHIKVMIHEHVDCEYSLWIDGRLTELLVDPIKCIFPLLAYDIDAKSLHTESDQDLGEVDPVDMVLMRHSVRNCAYKEAEVAIKQGKDIPEEVTKTVAYLRACSHPEDCGLYVGNMLVRRHSKSVIGFNELWWDSIAKGSFRDQLTLPLALRTSEISIRTVPHRMMTLWSKPGRKLKETVKRGNR